MTLLNADKSTVDPILTDRSLDGYSSSRQTDETPHPHNAPGAHVTPETSRLQALDWCLLAFIVTATIAAYSCVLFNFFNGDDFVHLTWLSQAIHQPELILRNFHSSWLDGTTTKFYRPLISVFMVTDYALWGINGLGFHLTNLAFHLTSTVMLFLITREVASITFSRSNTNALHVWPVGSALLFGLYPLHPEAVSWITGRVDAIVTAFILTAFWCYIRWRKCSGSMTPLRKVSWLVASAVSFVLALLSKEMAITLPAVLLLYEALVLISKPRSQMAPSLFANTRSAVLSTVPFWVIVAAYFAVRRWALGTFVGGYDDSLLFIADWKAFIGGWLHGLKMFIVPINKEFLGSHSPLTKIWEVTIIATMALVAFNVIRARAALISALFAAVWLLFSLAPVYKIFAIADDLQGSRLAYLATVPLCLLVSLGFVRSASANWPQRIIHMGAMILLTSAAFAILYTNNQAWTQAGTESNAIRSSLTKVYGSIPDDPQVLIVGLPDHYKGAYVCRNGLHGMTKAPQFFRNVYNCIMMNSFEPIMPFGYFKESLWEARDRVKIFRWDTQDKTLRPVALSQAQPKTPQNFPLPSLINESDSFNLASTSRLKDGSFEITTDSNKARRPHISVSIPGNCFTTEFITLKVEVLNPDTIDSTTGVDLLFKNDLNDNFDLYHRTHGELQGRSGVQAVVFPLRSLPEWALGGKSRGFQLMLPRHARLRLVSISVTPADNVIPRLSFHNSGYLGTKGFMHISQDGAKRQQELEVDASKMAGASSVELQISRANMQFTTQNTDKTETALIMKTLKAPGATTRLMIDREMFPSPGMYEIRPRAIDKDGNRIGLCGDHIVVSVDS